MGIKEHQGCQSGRGGANKGAGAARGGLAGPTMQSFGVSDEDSGLADEGDKHAGPWNRMCKVCALYNIKLSKGVPDLHSLRVNLSSVLHLAGEDISLTHIIWWRDPARTTRDSALQSSSILKTVRGNFSTRACAATGFSANWDIPERPLPEYLGKTMEVKIKSWTVRDARFVERRSEVGPGRAHYKGKCQEVEGSTASRGNGEKARTRRTAWRVLGQVERDIWW